MPPLAVLMLAAFAGPALALPQSAREPEGLRMQGLAMEARLAAPLPTA